MVAGKEGRDIPAVAVVPASQNIHSTTPNNLLLAPPDQNILTS